MIPVIPFLFLLAMAVLIRIPRAIAYSIAILAFAVSWCLSMVRSGVIDSMEKVFFQGFQLPWLTVLGKLAPQYAPFLASGTSPLALFALLGIMLFIIWRCPRPCRRTVLLHNAREAPAILPLLSLPLVSDVPVLGRLFFRHQPLVYPMFGLVIAVHVLLFYTRWGLHTRAVGEHPRAADTVGINVFSVRYRNVIAGGMIAGLGGAWFSLETVGSFEDLMTNGKGFIALAAMIFGKWNPLGALGGALLFGFADALQIKLQIAGVNVPYQFLGMIPYVVTMIVLAGVIGRALPPAARRLINR